MSFLTSRRVSLSVALLLASTSLAHAGFIWLSPDKQTPDSTVYSQQAAPAAPVESADAQGRAWTVDPSVPVAGAPVAPAPAPTMLSPDTAPVGVSGTAPMQLSSTEPAAPAASAPAPVEAPAAPAASVQMSSDTMSSQPVYSPGDRPAAPVDMSAAAPVAPAPSVIVSSTPPAPAPEVTLASSQNMPLPTPAARQGSTASGAMPGAEAMINSMPSMTTPRAEAAAAPVAPAPEPAPVVLAQTSPATEAASAPMLSPATAPMQTASATSPAPVSLVTGQSMETAGTVPMEGTDKVVSGFGKHVPLVIAMRQILPSGYGFAHGDGVDLSASIDWQGGRPWPQVLSEAVQPLGLTANVAGDTVMLEKAQVAMAPELTPPAVAPSAVLVPVSAPAPAPATLAPGQAVLTNATVMQAPPSNN